MVSLLGATPQLVHLTDDYVHAYLFNRRTSLYGRDESEQGATPQKFRDVARELPCKLPSQYRRQTPSRADGILELPQANEGGAHCDGFPAFNITRQRAVSVFG